MHMYERLSRDQVSSGKLKLTTAEVNKYVKLPLDMIAKEILYSTYLFMTTGLRVMSAEAARETLFEGKAGYCMSVCE